MTANEARILSDIFRIEPIIEAVDSVIKNTAESSGRYSTSFQVPNDLPYRSKLAIIRHYKEQGFEVIVSNPSIQAPIMLCWR